MRHEICQVPSMFKLIKLCQLISISFNRFKNAFILQECFHTNVKAFFAHKVERADCDVILQFVHRSYVPKGGAVAQPALTSHTCFAYTRCCLVKAVQTRQQHVFNFARGHYRWFCLAGLKSSPLPSVCGAKTVM